MPDGNKYTKSIINNANMQKYNSKTIVSYKCYRIEWSAIWNLKYWPIFFQGFSFKWVQYSIVKNQDESIVRTYQNRSNNEKWEKESEIDRLDRKTKITQIWNSIEFDDLIWFMNSSFRLLHDIGITTYYNVNCLFDE